MKLRFVAHCSERAGWTVSLGVSVERIPVLAQSHVDGVVSELERLGRSELGATINLLVESGSAERVGEPVD